MRKTSYKSETNEETMMCDVKKCKKPGDYKYLGHYICENHWELHCDGKFDLKHHFNIRKVGVSNETPLPNKISDEKKGFLTNYV